MTLVSKIEALLFVAEEPVSLNRLVEVLEAEREEVLAALKQLEQDCSSGRGILLVQIAGGYQLCTRLEVAEVVARFLRPARARLSRAQLEVLAIVAYQQPVTMAEIDAVRGVQSDHSLRALLDRRLVRELGRKSTPGRPLIYGTSEQFLHLFNLHGIEDLPTISLQTLEELGPVESAGSVS